MAAKPGASDSLEHQTNAYHRLVLSHAIPSWVKQRENNTSECKNIM